MATKTCDGNCLSCSFQQQVYCAAQRTYQMMKNQEVFSTRLANMEEAVEALRTAFSRFNSEGVIINPLVKPQRAEKEKDAQSEVGAEE